MRIKWQGKTKKPKMHDSYKKGKENEDEKNFDR